MMVINIIAALVILVRGAIAVSHMLPGTPVLVRAGWLLLAIGAAAIMLAGGPPAWPNVILHCGIAMLVWRERRLPFFCEKK